MAKSIITPGTNKKSLKAWETEQDWQGDGFNHVGVSLAATYSNLCVSFLTCWVQTWLTANAPVNRRDPKNVDRMFSVFAINFKMVTDSNDKSAIWVEAGTDSKTHYCYGPTDKKCTPSRSAADTAIIDSVNNAVLALETQPCREDRAG